MRTLGSSASLTPPPPGNTAPTPQPSPPHLGAAHDLTRSTQTVTKDVHATRSLGRTGEIVKTCGSRSLDCFRLGVLSGSFYEFAVDEGRAGTDQGDEVGSVDGVPAVLRCLDDPACDAVSGLEGAQFVDLGITRRGGRICALRCAGTDCPADAQAAEPVQQAIAGLVIHRCFPPLGAGGGLRGGPRRPVCGRIPPARDPQR